MAKQVVAPGQEDLIEQQTSATGPGLSSITLEESQRQQAYREAHPELYAYEPIDSGGFSFGKIFGVVLAVASLTVPFLGEIVGAAILEAVGITGATAAVEAGVGAAALSAGSVAAQGGSVEDVLKSAATAGFASGINIGLGGGVTGAAAGSLAGSAIQGGNVDQVLVNAIAAGAGAGVQGVLGPAAGTITRDLIKTGGVSDQTLIRAAVAEIGAFNKPGDRSAPIVEGQPMATPAAEEPVPTSITLEPKSETPAAAPEIAGPTLPTVTTDAPTIAPTVTDVDVMKQVASQQPTVPLEKVTVSGQGANVAPVETAVPSETVPSAKTIPSPTPAQPFPTPTITAEEKKEAPVVTDIPTIRPDTTAGLAPPQADLGTVNVGYVTDPFVDIAPPPDLGTKYINYPVDPFVDISPPPTEPTPVATEPVAPTTAKPVEFQQVTVSDKREPAPTITDIVAKTMEPPPAPTAPTAPTEPAEPEVKAEEAKKEESPKKEAKKLYSTVTSVPPPTRPGRQPIITGVSPARLLADALAAYRPAGAIEGEESGKERQNVWNEKSLRLKDALGL
jgi:hypothetical protein